jgi:hypothetical protein
VNGLEHREEERILAVTVSGLKSDANLGMAAKWNQNVL